MRKHTFTLAKRSSLWIVCILLACFLILTCGEDPPPDKEDLQRVKNSFLRYRFHSVLIPALQGKTDMQLFQIGCLTNDVECSLILDMLKKEDPSFYKKLTESKSTTE